MDRTPVDSSNVKSIGFENGVLEIEFANGVYRYNDVPRELADAFLSADSKGKYFAANIRKSFTGTKLEPQPVATED